MNNLNNIPTNIRVAYQPQISQREEDTELRYRREALKIVLTLLNNNDTSLENLKDCPKEIQKNVCDFLLEMHHWPLLEKVLAPIQENKSLAASFSKYFGFRDLLQRKLDSALAYFSFALVAFGDDFDVWYAYCLLKSAPRAYSVSISEVFNNPPQPLSPEESYLCKKARDIIKFESEEADDYEMKRFANFIEDEGFKDNSIFIDIILTYYFKRGFYQDALPLCDHLLKDNINSLNLVFTYRLIFEIQLGLKDDTFKLFKILEGDSRYTPWLRAAHQLKDESARYQLLLCILLSLRPIAPFEEEKRCLHGLIAHLDHYPKNIYLLAEGLALRALAFNPDDDELRYFLGRLYQQDNHPTFILCYEMIAPRLSALYPHISGDLGIHYAMQKKFELALPHLEKALEVEPKHASVYYYLSSARVYFEEYSLAKKMGKAALRLIEEAADRKPANLRAAHLQLTVIYSELANYTKAAHHGDQYLALLSRGTPPPEDHLEYVINAYLSTEQYKKALNYLRSCSSAMKKTPAFNRWRALLHYNSGRFDETIKFCQKLPLTEDVAELRFLAHYHKGERASDACISMIDLNHCKEETFHALTLYALRYQSLDLIIALHENSRESFEKNEIYQQWRTEILRLPFSAEDRYRLAEANFERMRRVSPPCLLDIYEKLSEWLNKATYGKITPK